MAYPGPPRSSDGSSPRSQNSFRSQEHGPFRRTRQEYDLNRRNDQGPSNRSPMGSSTSQEDYLTRNDSFTNYADPPRGREPDEDEGDISSDEWNLAICNARIPRFAFFVIPLYGKSAICFNPTRFHPGDVGEIRVKRNLKCAPTDNSQHELIEFRKIPNINEICQPVDGPTVLVIAEHCKETRYKGKRVSVLKSPHFGYIFDLERRVPFGLLTKKIAVSIKSIVSPMDRRSSIFVTCSYERMEEHAGIIVEKVGSNCFGVFCGENGSSLLTIEGDPYVIAEFIDISNFSNWKLGDVVDFGKLGTFRPVNVCYSGMSFESNIKFGQLSIKTIGRNVVEGNTANFVPNNHSRLFGFIDVPMNSRNMPLADMEEVWLKFDSDKSRWVKLESQRTYDEESSYAASDTSDTANEPNSEENSYESDTDVATKNLENLSMDELMLRVVRNPEVAFEIQREDPEAYEYIKSLYR